MAKKSYIVTLPRGGLFLDVAGEKRPVKFGNGALVKLEPEEAKPLVLAGSIRPYDAAVDSESVESGDGDGE